LRKDFPLAGKPTDLPNVAFTKVTPMEGGPFVTIPSTSSAISREPRVRVPEGAEPGVSDKRLGSK
jgi:NADH-quinone oxidoreductase subunit C